MEKDEAEIRESGKEAENKNSKNRRREQGMIY